jgi:hypothetical protein
LSGRLRAGLGYVAGGALTVLVLAGPWFVLLAREFGNPVFPLLNAWFHSPDGPSYNIANVRFTPADWKALLGFPFRMATLDRALYSENFAPDIRFAALVAALAALPVLAVRRPTPQAALGPLDWRVLGFFAAGFALWLASSANARYGLPVLLLAGLALARLVERALPLRAARLALALLLALQVARPRAGTSPTPGPSSGLPISRMSAHCARPRCTSPSSRCRSPCSRLSCIPARRSSTFAGSSASRPILPGCARCSSDTAATCARSAARCAWSTAGRTPKP